MPTLLTYRQTCAEQLGPFVTGTATSGSTGSVLEALTWPFVSSIGQNDLYVDQFLFRPSPVVATDKTRVVATYTPSTGLLTPDQAWTNNPWNQFTVVGEAFEVHGVVPPVVDGKNDLHAIINYVLQRMLTRVEFTFSVTDTQVVRHSLATAAPWLSANWQPRAVAI